MTSTTTTTGRRRTAPKTYTAEDQALDQIAREAEARLAAKRAARSEAREIRMKELEKQQRENEEKQDRIYELTNDIPKPAVRQYGSRQANDEPAAAVRPYGSRRGSDESSEDGSTREIRSQLSELDEKYKKAMVGTAQLHNEKQALVYEVDLLKDQLEEREEEVIEYQREFKDKCKELESKKRTCRDLENDFKTAKHQLEQRDKIIDENGLAIVISDEGVWTLVKAASPNGPLTAGLPTMDMVNSKLASETDTSLGESTLVLEENRHLKEELIKLTQQLEEERSKKNLDDNQIIQANGPEMQLYEIQREASKQIHEYKLKLQKAEQDIATLEGSVNRLDSQVRRYKTDAEDSEKMEDELKQEKRKLGRELREAQSQIEELRNHNSHLQKRLEKMKQTRTLVK